MAFARRLVLIPLSTPHIFFLDTTAPDTGRSNSSTASSSSTTSSTKARMLYASLPRKGRTKDSFSCSSGLFFSTLQPRSYTSTTSSNDPILYTVKCTSQSCLFDIRECDPKRRIGAAMLQFSFQQRFTLHLGFRNLIALLEGVNVIHGRFVFVISTDQRKIRFATILSSCSSHLQPVGIPRPLPSLTDSTPRRTQFPIHQGVFVEKSTPSSSGSLSAEETSLSTGVELSSSSLIIKLMPVDGWNKQ